MERGGVELRHSDELLTKIMIVMQIRHIPLPLYAVLFLDPKMVTKTGPKDGVRLLNPPTFGPVFVTEKRVQNQDRFLVHFRAFF